jgi:hypothetical protein
MASYPVSSGIYEVIDSEQDLEDEGLRDDRHITEC